LSDTAGNYLAAPPQGANRCDIIVCHQTAVTNNICAEDGGKFAFETFPGHRVTRLFFNVFRKKRRMAEADGGLSGYPQVRRLGNLKGLLKSTGSDMHSGFGDKNLAAGVQNVLQLAEKFLLIVDLVHHPEA